MTDEQMEELTAEVDMINGLTVVNDVVLWSTKYKEQEDFRWKKDGKYEYAVLDARMFIYIRLVLYNYRKGWSHF